jgi:regulatory protein
VLKTTTMPQEAIIHAIEPIDNDGALVLVRFGRRRIRARRIDVEPLGLQQGDPVTTDTLAHLEHAAATAKAWNVALRTLARRPMARATLRARLGRRFGDNAACAVIDTLTAQGLLDDDAAAASLRRGLEHRGPVGPAKFAQALARHGIDPDAADAALQDMQQTQDPVEAATQAAMPMLRSLARFDRPTQERRLAGRLARRGFDADTVQQVLEAVLPRP